MKKIVFFCIPAHGHTNPTLGVVRELVNRGHHVWYYSYNFMKEKIEATGATFVSCDDYDMERKLSAEDTARIGKDMAFSTRILVDTTLALDDYVCKEMERLQPDCIVADSMAVWGKAVALKMGIPFVSSTTTFAFNKYSAKIMKQSTGELFKMILSMPAVFKDIKRLQNKGYPVKNIIDIIRNDENTHTIVYTSPEFQPCSETFSDKYAFVGPSVRPAVDTIEKTKNKLVYISMGTVNNNLPRLYKDCITAFRDTEYQVIMSVGNSISSKQFGDLPENISVFQNVDQIAVLEKADVFISHCGMNSASESLYYGVPLIMLPQTSEQAAVAERIYQLKAGMKLTDTDALSLRNAVDAVLSDNIYKTNAEKISAGFRACTGAKGAADKIIRVCESNT